MEYTKNFAPNPPKEPSPWDALIVHTEQTPETARELAEDNELIDGWLKKGRIDKDKAKRLRQEIKDKADRKSTKELSPEARQYLKDEYLNIADMQSHGRFDEAKAEQFRQEVQAKAVEMSGITDAILPLASSPTHEPDAKPKPAAPAAKKHVKHLKPEPIVFQSSKEESETREPIALQSFQEELEMSEPLILPSSQEKPVEPSILSGSPVSEPDAKPKSIVPEPVQKPVQEPIQVVSSNPLSQSQPEPVAPVVEKNVDHPKPEPKQSIDYTETYDTEKLSEESHEDAKIESGPALEQPMTAEEYVKHIADELNHSVEEIHNIAYKLGWSPEAAARYLLVEERERRAAEEQLEIDRKWQAATEKDNGANQRETVQHPEHDIPSMPSVLSDEARRQIMQHVAVSEDKWSPSFVDTDGKLRALQDSHLRPEYSLGKIGGAEIYLSHINNNNRISNNDNDKEHRYAYAVAYIKTPEDDKVHPRLFYRSNSSMLWRFLPAYGNYKGSFVPFSSERWFSKSEQGEDALNAPFAMQQALQSVSELDSSNNFPGQSPIDIHSVSWYTVDSSLFNKRGSSGDLSEYTSKISPYGRAELAPGRETGEYGLADPNRLAVSDDASPNFAEGPLYSWHSNSPIYGKVNAYCYASNDEKLRYLFFQEAEGERRPWIAAIESADAKVSSLGLNDEFVEPGCLTIPLYEYKGFTYDKTGRNWGDYEDKPGDTPKKKHKSSYIGMWNYLKNIPMIKDFLAHQSPQNVESAQPPETPDEQDQAKEEFLTGFLELNQQ